MGCSKTCHRCVHDGSLVPLPVLGSTSPSPGLTPGEPDPVSMAAIDLTLTMRHAPCQVFCKRCFPSLKQPSKVNVIVPTLKIKKYCLEVSVLLIITLKVGGMVSCQVSLVIKPVLFSTLEAL